MQRTILLAGLAVTVMLFAGCASTPRTLAPRTRSARAPAAQRGHAVQQPQMAVPPRKLAHTKIALLLPETGRLHSAAQNVRDGFLTAYYQLPAAERPRVRIYDTAGAASVSSVIARASHAGADFIIGPLVRTNVAMAAVDNTPHPPMLTLNFLPHGVHPPAHFFQFALSPTAEARLVAKRVLADGHRLGIAIVPQSQWGTRVLKAFTQQLHAGGGRLLDTVHIEPSASDFSGPIERVLLIRQSRNRLRRLESLLGVHLAFVPRRRADIQFIFAPARASVERMLEPQLRFYYANNVPTYSVSNAFAPNPTANQDLDGLRFLDMPWMLGDPLSNAVHSVVDRAWPAGGPDRGRLFAFGFDAYHLAVALFVRHEPPGSLVINGLTGRLSINAQGRVQRGLLWARLQNGTIKILPSK